MLDASKRNAYYSYVKLEAAEKSFPLKENNPTEIISAEMTHSASFGPVISKSQERK